MVQRDKQKLVVFDVEGVLIPRNRFLFDLGKKAGLIVLLKVFFYGFLYEAGILNLESTLRRIFKNLKGTKIDTILEIFSRIPSRPYLQNLCQQLKARNCKVALISSGIPTVTLEKLSVALGADYVYGVEVEIINGKLTGEILGEAISKNGKFKILSEILQREGLSDNDCIVVADDRNNSCIFLPDMLKIGFNPDFIIRVKADRVVNGKLSNILPIIDGKRKQYRLETNDLVRETIHASGLFMPIIAGIVGLQFVVLTIILIAAAYTISELARLEKISVPVISHITRNAASTSELYGFAAAPLYFAFGITSTLILFPTTAGAAAIAMFCLGDSTASLFGGLVSDALPFNKGKTWEGTLSGFFFAFLGGCLFVPPLIALVGAAVAMTIEVLPSPINDNITVPIITGALLTLLL